MTPDVTAQPGTAADPSAIGNRPGDEQSDDEIRAQIAALEAKLSPSSSPAAPAAAATPAPPTEPIPSARKAGELVALDTTDPDGSKVTQYGIVLETEASAPVTNDQGETTGYAEPRAIVAWLTGPASYAEADLRAL